MLQEGCPGLCGALPRRRLPLVPGLLPLLPPLLQLRLHRLGCGEEVALHKVHLLALVLVLQRRGDGGLRAGARRNEFTRSGCVLRLASPVRATLGNSQGQVAAPDAPQQVRCRCNPLTADGMPAEGEGCEQQGPWHGARAQRTQRTLPV